MVNGNSTGQKEPSERPVNFYKMNYNDSEWAEIPVPSTQESLGHGTPYLYKCYISIFE